MDWYLTDVDILIRDYLRALPCYARLTVIRVFMANCESGWDAEIAGSMTPDDEAKCKALVASLKKRVRVSRAREVQGRIVPIPVCGYC
jgi:hypothetical protein